MAIEKFELGSLKTMDGGRLREAFEQLLKMCRDDCQDRPGVPKERTVTLTGKLVPVQAPDGSMESCDVTFEFDSKLPKRCSPSYNMKSAPGGLFFNELSREDIRQGTLDEVPGPKEVTDAS